MKLNNNDFYNADGEFQVEKARDAYFAMMESFNYPVTDKLRAEMWATDFGLGDFTGAGMAGIFWVNDPVHKYFGHEIFLLPGQMIVEHSHVPAGDVAAKMESWQVRNGMIYTFAEGDETVPCPVQTPASQTDFITAKQVKEVPIGEVDTLNRPEAMHFMLGGPQGAIVTEYATFHDNEGLRFTNPNVKF